MEERELKEHQEQTSAEINEHQALLQQHQYEAETLDGEVEKLLEQKHKVSSPPLTDSLRRWVEERSYVPRSLLFHGFYFKYKLLLIKTAFSRATVERLTGKNIE